jgi:hypothetical protein
VVVREKTAVCAQASAVVGILDDSSKVNFIAAVFTANVIRFLKKRIGFFVYEQMDYPVFIHAY